MEPIERCAATVEKSAPIIDAATTPSQPLGTNVSMAGYARSPFTSAGFTWGNAFWRDARSGNTMSEAKAVRYQGHGRIA